MPDNNQEDPKATDTVENSKPIEVTEKPDAAAKNKKDDGKISEEKGNKEDTWQNGFAPKEFKIRSESNVEAFLQELVKEAFEKKASDIHFEPRQDDMLIRYRIDGILRDMHLIDKKTEKALIFKLKIASGLRTDEHFAPQDGRIEFVFNKVPIDSRLSIIATTNGQKAVLRLLVKQGRALSLEELGLEGEMLERVKRAHSKPHGMIIAAGPTGSGKTTTLYSILNIINTREKNITTIEDPVEYEIPGVNHIHVNPKAGLTFASGLRSMLRQDPNIIMVGEIRDNETARIAINAAMTGHLVLSSIHTNDAITTIPRFLDMGIEAYLVASTVNLIAAQRLARRLCEKCKKKTRVEPEKYEEMVKYRPDIAELIKKDEEIFQEQGCEACEGTGFKGRVGIYEVLELSKAIRNVIIEGADSDVLFDTARKEGLVILVEDAVKKVKAGLVSVSEIMRVTALKE